MPLLMYLAISNAYALLCSYMDPRVAEEEEDTLREAEDLGAAGPQDSEAGAEVDIAAASEVMVVDTTTLTVDIKQRR
jgi:hypothetical protein